MAENNKRSISDATSPSPQKQHPPKKTDIKETPNKPHATGEDQEMADNYNIIASDVIIDNDLSLIQQEDSIWSTNTNDKDNLLDGTEVIHFLDDKVAGDEKSDAYNLNDEQEFERLKENCIEKFNCLLAM